MRKFCLSFLQTWPFRGGTPQAATQREGKPQRWAELENGRELTMRAQICVRQISRPLLLKLLLTRLVICS